MLDKFMCAQMVVSKQSIHIYWSKNFSLIILKLLKFSTLKNLPNFTHYCPNSKVLVVFIKIDSKAPYFLHENFLKGYFQKSFLQTIQRKKKSIAFVLLGILFFILMKSTNNFQYQNVLWYFTKYSPLVGGTPT